MLPAPAVLQQELLAAGPLLHFTPRGHGRRWLLGLSHLSGLLHWRLRSRSLGICTWRTTLLVFDLTGEVKYSGL